MNRIKLFQCFIDRIIEFQNEKPDFNSDHFLFMVNHLSLMTRTPFGQMKYESIASDLIYSSLI